MYTFNLHNFFTPYFINNSCTCILSLIRNIYLTKLYFPDTAADYSSDNSSLVSERNSKALAYLQPMSSTYNIHASLISEMYRFELIYIIRTRL